MNLLDPESISWLRLSLTPRIGPITFWQLINQYGSALAALDFLQSESNRLLQVSLASVEMATKVNLQMERLKGQILTPFDSNYPFLLKQIPDPPPVLYCMGDSKFLGKGNIAMVGGRNASMAGQNFAKSLAKEISQYGVPVVSGLARGIDTAAHMGALDGGAGTIAVLAGGVDVVYPQQNSFLYERIIRSGLIISEMPPQTIPTARLFPKRNRIISGLCYGTIVIEASVKSGSLITARCAIEQDREVLAVPGFPADPRHQGCNELIKNGAALVESMEDIADALPQLPLSKASSRISLATTLDGCKSMPHLGTLFSLLSTTPVDFEDLLSQTGWPVAMLSEALAELEVLGYVARVNGQFYQTANEINP
ncbi:MAG: DNA-processing protein DprA [Alphaproteobacteria bacterium]|mgnify:CR=1 FL=1|nr:DNA-processing protein DprA [Alphaproteobacteria bacterium]OJV46596.1 MAG: DNA protecting protein DprA [Alphaproteobacteria bacterium 43-37]